MSTYTKQTSVPLWHYHCPDCGITDQDTGYHAATDAIYCEVCLEESRHIRLRRWPVDVPVDMPVDVPPDGATTS